MIGDNVPDLDHIVRYVSPRQFEGDIVNGNAFCLRSTETGLSVNWLEVFGGVDLEFQLDNVKRFIRLNLSRNGKFARLNVGITKRYVRNETQDSESKEIGIVQSPLIATSEFEADPSHSEITDLPSQSEDGFEAEFVGDLIAKCVIHSLHSIEN